MTASQTLTPSQARFVMEHKARRQRFAAKAKPDTPIACPSASVRANTVNDVPPEPTPVLSYTEHIAEWINRQRERYNMEVAISSDAPLPSKPSVAQIQRACSLHLEVSLVDLNSARRTAFIVRARQIGMYLAKVLSSRSLPEIGRKFGNRDHTTVLHAVRKIGRAIENDPDMAEDVAKIKAIIDRTLVRTA